MDKELPQILQMYDENGDYAWFRQDMAFSYKGDDYVILTHVDEYGHDLSDESTLFLTEEYKENGQPFTSYEPVEDEELIELIEQYLETLEGH